MRPLLVQTRDPLPDDLRRTLESCRWLPFPVLDLGEAVAATSAHDIYVALVILAADADRPQFNNCRQAIYALPGLRWVALMTRDQAEKPAIKQLIAERLYDFQVAPIEPLRLCHALGHAHGIARIEQDLLQQAPESVSGRYGMTGTSAAMRALFDAIERVAATDAALLITGPTGTGKELVARAIHAQSVRATGPLVSLNCAAIPAALMQSELFGHARGAFTGASKSRLGLVESAAGGTLFLDEIGEMPIDAQASLLRFLDSGSIQSLGVDTQKKVDVRVVAATNRELDEEAGENRFRADLYYRLSVLTLRTPPLKDRGRDVELLAEQFLRQARSRFDAVAVGLSQNALAALRQHHWPGNVRELRSRVYQAAINCERRYIEPEDLDLGGIRGAEPGRPLTEIRNRAERDAVESVLSRHGQNVKRAAEELQVSRMTLYRLMEKYHLPVGKAGAR